MKATRDTTKASQKGYERTVVYRPRRQSSETASTLRPCVTERVMAVYGGSVETDYARLDSVACSYSL